MQRPILFHMVKTFFAVCCLIGLLAVCPLVAQTPELGKLIDEVSVDSQKGAIFNYSYQMTVYYNRHKFGGRRFTKVYEVVLPSRFSLNHNYTHPLILVKDSEREVTDEEVRRTREGIAKEIEKAEKFEEASAQSLQPRREDGGYWAIGFSANARRIRIDVLELLKNSRFSNLRRIPNGTGNIVAVDFEPNPGSNPDMTLSYLSKIEGQIWIDESAKRIIRIEGFAIGEYATLKEKPDSERKEEAVFLFEQTKVSEGYWFPQTVRFNSISHPKIYDPLELEFTFSKYNKASVDVQYQEEKSASTGSTPQKSFE